MFEHRTEPFGNFEKHIVEDKDRGHLLAFVPGHGCGILDIQVANISILDGYQTPLELELDNWGKSGLLFPFPNRLAAGQYTWEGTHYNFPINELTTGTALHGFGMDKPFRVVRVHPEATQVAIACQLEYDGSIAYYPFPFRLRIDLSLDQSGSFEMEYRCWNTGQNIMPWGFGWHPYFQVSERVQDAQLKTPLLDMIGVDEQMIPTGKRYEFDEFTSESPIGATVLDNCFAPREDASPSLELTLRGERGTLHYWQETGEEGMNFVQLFTPPYRKSLAIEPMSCNIDAFNNGEGLIALQPGAMARGRFGFRFQPNASE